MAMFRVAKLANCMSRQVAETNPNPTSMPEEVKPANGRTGQKHACLVDPEHFLRGPRGGFAVSPGHE
jgi:hypothetical protein